MINDIMKNVDKNKFDVQIPIDQIIRCLEENNLKRLDDFGTIDESMWSILMPTPIEIAIK